MSISLRNKINKSVTIKFAITLQMTTIKTLIIMNVLILFDHKIPPARPERVCFHEISQNNVKHIWPDCMNNMGLSY